MRWSRQVSYRFQSWTNKIHVKVVATIEKQPCFSKVVNRTVNTVRVFRQYGSSWKVWEQWIGWHDFKHFQFLPRLSLQIDKFWSTQRPNHGMTWLRWTKETVCTSQYPSFSDPFGSLWKVWQQWIGWHGFKHPHFLPRLGSRLASSD
jgi:hypothetical protein